MKRWIVVPALVFASPALAQSHSGHGSHDQEQVEDSKAKSEPVHDHSSMDHASGPATDAPIDHSAMNHGQSAGPEIPVLGPPPEAGSGPPSAADAIWGTEAMRTSRKRLAYENGGMPFFWFQIDRAEYQLRDGKDGFLWDIQGYYGGDLDRFWFKSEGEGDFDEGVEDAEIQALWSHAITPFFDLQAGLRQDLTGAERTHGVLGIQGMAPYFFEVDAAAFISNKGDLTARIEGEIDQRLTQSLIIQPRVEAEFSAQNIPELGTGAGLSKIEAGLRLRYAFKPEFAPYIGVEIEQAVGQTADYKRLDGEDPTDVRMVFGIRAWF